MTPRRRMGPNGSAVWTGLLDAAESILRDEGYAALTSRGVADRAGVKRELVYYYFETMEHLTAEVFRRLSKRELDRLIAAADSDRPLREIWDVCVHTSDARLVSEFMAAANRSDSLRAEVVDYIEQARRIQVEAVARAAKAAGCSAGGLSPVEVSLLATSLALTLMREAGLGISSGHAEMHALIERSLAVFEPQDVEVG
jgi:AcrR family transcriptional regulator